MRSPKLSYGPTPISRGRLHNMGQPRYPVKRRGRRTAGARQARGRRDAAGRGRLDILPRAPYHDRAFPVPEW